MLTDGALFTERLELNAITWETSHITELQKAQLISGWGRVKWGGWGVGWVGGVAVGDGGDGVDVACC